MTESAQLHSARRSWAEFNLTSRRPHLDATAQSLIDAREASLAARKRLGELTKSLKGAIRTATSAAGGDKDAALASLAAECKTTIKSYQEEIDGLTKRCKSAEGSFVQLYRSLYECADPAMALEEALRLIDGRDGQVANLLKAMEALNSELDGLRDEKDRLAGELDAKEGELAEARKDAAGGVADDGGASGGTASALTLAEREELIKLRGDVAEYEVEFRSLKNQDITIRKLESKIEDLEENREEEIQKELKKAQEELAESEGRRATEALEREASTARRLESVELQLRAERAGREASATQLLKAEDGQGEREAAWEAQRQILVADSERLREEISELSVDRDRMRLRLEALTSSSTSSGGVDLPPPSGGAPGKQQLAAYEAEIGELSTTCNALREEIRAKDAAAEKERRAAQARADALVRERSGLANKVSSLELKAANAPSQEEVDKMRHELRILKRLEYNAVDLDHHGAGASTPGDDPSNRDDGDLESVLVAKLRKVEADLVRERREKAEAAKDKEGLLEKLSAAEKSAAEQEKLIASLENDLQLAVATPASASKKMRSEAADHMPSTNPPDPNTLRSILDPDAPPIATNPSPPTPLIKSKSAAEREDDDTSIATIVMAQRDRLRARCDALESERDSFKLELQAQVSAAEGLKADNTKLYEKVRYLQSFGGGGRSAHSAAGVRSRGVSGGGDLDLEALEQRYEANVDPFRQFSRAERQRKYNEMPPMEKVVFVVAKTFLGSKEMRKALFFYVIGMHLLVFVTTYHWSHSSTCDSIHRDALVAHMHGDAPPV